jgi:hypothetical protein
MATPQDLVNADLNLATLDGVVTSDAASVPDRNGVQRLTLAEIERLAESAVASAGFVPAAGSFELGGTIDERNQVLLRTTAPAGYFSWGGVLPKVVPAASTVAGTGGEGVAAWTNRNDATFASQLAAADSAVLVGGVEAGYIGNVVAKTTFVDDPIVTESYSLMLGDQFYAGNLGAGSVLLGTYAGSSRNKITGSPSQLRGVIGGYDNEINSATTADGLACGIVWSMHSKISNNSDHSGIGFGSYHEIERGSYSAILSGTFNKIIGTTNPSRNQNSVIVGGARTEVDGANCVAGGTDNKTRGNGLTVFGILNNVGLTTASDLVYVSGQSNTVNRSYSFTHGLSNTSSRDYSFTCGRSNATNADYTVAKGRGAIVGIAFSDTFGFDTGSNAGSNQRDRYPLQVTTTNATATNMVTVIQGSVGDVMPDGTVCAASATVIATDGTDTAVFDLKACIRRNAGTSVVYNLSSKIGNTAGAATWAAVFGGQNDRRVVVTGEAGKTIKWTADVTLVTTRL